LAINTGLLRTRSGQPAKQQHSTQSADPERRKKMEHIVRRLHRIRDIMDNVFTDDRIENSEKSCELLLSDEKLAFFRHGELRHSGVFLWCIKHRWPTFGRLPSFLEERFSVRARQMLDEFPAYSPGTQPPQLTEEQDRVLVDELNTLIMTQVFPLTTGHAATPAPEDQTEARLSEQIRVQRNRSILGVFRESCG
jgi:hypothetical protein